MQVQANEDIGKCGCGRSPTGKCCGYHALTPEQWEVKKQEIALQPTIDAGVAGKASGQN